VASEALPTRDEFERWELIMFIIGEEVRTDELKKILGSGWRQNVFIIIGEKMV